MAGLALSTDIVSDHLMGPINLNGLFNSEFLPQRQFSVLMSRENVRATITSHFTDPDEAALVESLIQYSMTNQRVFLICVLTNQMRFIRGLYQAGFSDNQLPVQIGTREAHYPLSTSQSQPLNCFNHNPWDGYERRQFANFGWKLSTFTFRGVGFSSFTIDENCPLPYVQVEDTTASDDHGHFGMVNKVGLLREHFEATAPRYLSSIDSLGAYQVAVKQLRIEGANTSEIAKYFKNEKETLEIMSQLNHPHLIQAIAAYERESAGPETRRYRYFVFPWASMGNLRSFWRRNDHSESKQDLISWALKQMRGLMEGLMKLHEGGTRHGDVKPENILMFSDERHNLPTLVIADVGIAKFHAQETQKRQADNYSTTNKNGSLRYEPPEIERNPNSRRFIPRRYDVWSMGCVLLEFVIWLLHGSKKQDQFNTELRTKEPRLQRFWHVKGADSCIHPVVTDWIEKLHKETKRSPVLAELLNLVEDRMLDVRVEPVGGNPNASEQRADAVDVHQRLCDIEKQSLENPLLLWDPNSTPLTELEDTTTTKEDDDDTVAVSQRYRTSELIDRWETVIHPCLATWPFFRVHAANMQPLEASSPHPCGFCATLDFGSRTYELHRDMEDIRTTSSKCALCCFLYRRLSVTDASSQGHLTLYREGSTIRTSPDGQPVISLYCNTNVDSTPTHAFAQLGLPVLPRAFSTEQLTLLDAWIQTCNEDHECVDRAGTTETHVTLPTRVIEVGDGGSKPMRLVESRHMSSTKRYLALSHRWGHLNDDEKFCLIDDNLEEMGKTIPYDRLPQSFQDAVRLTRALHIDYLWIDSLCIIQDNKNDWETEAAKMEDVFSNAYCTIAASSAESSIEGFLGQRPGRDVCSVDTPSGLLHLAEPIDDFTSHVEGSVLNSRGWVLEERALSRRTMHFTATQVYWECGRGVFCETLARLRNPQSQFFGDCNFPSMGRSYFKDEQIRLVQYLYRRYSALSLSIQTDRSKAILGLQTRVGRTFLSGAQYGVLWRWLERTLLWHGESSNALKRIKYDSGNSVPSWSWMSYYGPIGFLEIASDSVDWTENITPPATADSRHPQWEGRLEVQSDGLLIDGPELLKRALLDEPSHENETSSWRCVVVGRKRVQTGSDEALHYVLLIRPLILETPNGLFVRVGVATLLAGHISAETRADVLI